MNTDLNGERFPDIDRILADVFTEDAPPSEPPLLIPALLARTALTRQRPAWRIPSRWLPPNIAWRPRPHGRLNTMATPIRIAAAATAIGVLAVVGGIVPRTPGPGGDDLASPSPSPGPSAVPFSDAGAIPPGTYHTPDEAGGWTVTVPAGWEWWYGVLWADVDGETDFQSMGGPGEVAFGWWTVANVFADPCHWKDSLVDPPVGPAVQDLATAFAAQVGRDGSVTDAVFAGYPAMRVELSVPADLDVTTCDEGVYREFITPGESPLTLPGGDPDTSKPVVGGRIDVLYILDIDGRRYMMRTWHEADSSEQDLVEMEAMLGSIRLDLPVPSPSPAHSPPAAG
jgi:hypothetical protein